jgi:hypothetical protein
LIASRFFIPNLLPLRAQVDHIKALVAQGKSPDEITKELGEPDSAPGAPNFRTFTEVVHK